MSKQEFPYYYGQEVELHSFYRVPKQLMTDPMFDGLSAEAKLLYGILLDRMQLSQKNEWFDESGRVYLYFTIESIMEVMHCSDKKARRLMNELDDKKGIGLITRVRQGLCKPDKLYVHNCDISDRSKIPDRNGKNDRSGNVETTGQDRYEIRANNTDKNNTEYNNTESITSFYSGEEKRSEASSSASCSYEEYQEWEEYLAEQLQIEDLKRRREMDADMIQEIFGLVVDTMCSKRKTIRIAGEDMSMEIVKSRFMKLNAEHVQFVMNNLSQNTTRIKNIKQYLLTSLYNSTLTIDSYYTARVQYDNFCESQNYAAKLGCENANILV